MKINRKTSGSLWNTYGIFKTGAKTAYLKISTRLALL